MKSLAFSFLFILSSISAYGATEKGKLKPIFDSQVIIILAEKPNDEDHHLTIQDYFMNGKSFIPVFTSMEKFKESTKNTDLGKPIYGIKGVFFASLLNGKETIIVNPSLPDELTVLGSDLINEYRKEIEEFHAKNKP